MRRTAIPGIIPSTLWRNSLSRSLPPILLTALLAGTIGCASQQARNHRRYRQAPRPYPAVRMNFGDPEWPVESGEGYFDFDSLISICILPFDLPVSLVTDTALLPVDILRWRSASRGAYIVSNALYGADHLSPEVFAEHYTPVQSARVVRRYLTGPSESISPAKLDLLLDAGVDTALLAESRRIDEGFAEQLLDRILQQADSRDSLISLAQNKELPASTLVRLARVDDPRVLSLVSAHPHTPSDVLRILVSKTRCLESIISNTNTPPDLLYSLVDNPSCETWPNTDRFLRNPATPPEALLKILHRTQSARARDIVTHPNVTPVIVDTVMALADKALGSNDLTAKKRYHYDQALEKLAGQQLSHDKMLLLASMPLPRTLVALSRNRSADREVLSAVLETCRGIPDTDNHELFFRNARKTAQGRLNNM